MVGGEESSANQPLTALVSRKTDLVSVVEASRFVPSANSVLMQEILRSLRNQGDTLTFTPIPLQNEQAWSNLIGHVDDNKYGSLNLYIDDPRLLERKLTDYKQGDITEEDILKHVIQSEKRTISQIYTSFLETVKRLDESKSLSLEARIQRVQQLTSNLDIHVGYLFKVKELDAKVGAQPELKGLLTSALQATIQKETYFASH